MQRVHVTATEIFVQDALLSIADNDTNGTFDLQTYLSSFLIGDEVVLLQSTALDAPVWIQIDSVCFDLLDRAARLHPHLQSLIDTALEFSAKSPYQTSTATPRVLSTAAIIGISILLLLTVESIEVNPNSLD